MHCKLYNVGIIERKEREKAEMRRRIVDVAVKMIVEEGYEKVSIRNIADKIEYSPATIYLYYKDKDQLLYDVQTEAFATLAKDFLQKVTHTDPFKRLEQLAHAYLDFSRNHPELYDLMFIIKAPMNALVEKEKWENGDPAYDGLYHLMQECIDKKVVKFKDATIGTLSVWAFAHGFVSLHLRGRCSKVSGVSDEEMPAIMNEAIKEYLRMIKA
ncbi:DNA-binding transcriptional regulator, AcrR family [Chitinophaga arvensicola]|uniref:DNA-binding transcriptional regulator, AcrR family n=2 Tax=Chitinophaga arvensicola TaxID=29529 RepID=A0A1I0RJ42_9BACT|nr:DNA-binding transcriptional regulator, AcrR family [Chitinophaga arvensicola]